MPRGSSDSGLLGELSTPPLVLGLLTAVVLMSFAGVYPGDVPGGVIGSTVYYAFRFMGVVAAWLSL